MITVTVKHGEDYYTADLTTAQAMHHDNGALISCGLTVPDSLRLSTLRRWIANGTARSISRVTYQHSGCQSECVLRGHQSCRW